ncbi:MAG: hypothetical protein C5B49_07140 [Bdellovibrio sp.]|nr:MAG: hypothetical protein C5B49_07140 [Bdellovibrio sp.]
MSNAFAASIVDMLNWLFLLPCLGSLVFSELAVAMKAERFQVEAVVTDQLPENADQANTLCNPDGGNQYHFAGEIIDSRLVTRWGQDPELRFYRNAFAFAVNLMSHRRILSPDTERPIQIVLCRKNISDKKDDDEPLHSITFPVSPERQAARLNQMIQSTKAYINRAGGQQ